ncbi:uncharacterized protein T069G_10914 [Trichoderma breve]|uniref:Uncharacterized protein n=1 Tax=Trichoderma breve TaxID=2034170 RepID=A0A9W9B993_9HYPO|nr:uncharacterized protein T069G_10914 [Trichoderma breve]KAJ4855356.1 hypothetical protein T069G_10914 [Trichoderma breve]
MHLSLAILIALSGMQPVAAQCTTSTQVMVGIDTTVTDLNAFQSSLNSAFPVSSGGDSDTTIFVHTSLYTYPGGSFYGYATADPEQLKSAGFHLVTMTQTTTSCPPTTTEETSASFSLPPSPTGSICTPHEDHWHCSPTNSVSEPSATCSPHFDHWHCPPGVPSPTYLPLEATGTSSFDETTTGGPSRTSAATSAPSTVGTNAASKPMAMTLLGIVSLACLISNFV